jgi:hypothetical protein
VQPLPPLQLLLHHLGWTQETLVWTRSRENVFYASSRPIQIAESVIHKKTSFIIIVKNIYTRLNQIMRDMYRMQSRASKNPDADSQGQVGLVLVL